MLCLCLLAQLHSQDEVIRDTAAGASRHLARQCSDPGSVEKLVKHFFAVLNGKNVVCVSQCYT